MNSINQHARLGCALAFSILVLAACPIVLSLHEQGVVQALKAAPVAASSDPTAFLSTWDTTRTSAGSSASNQIMLPLVSNGTYNFVVAWGDGTTSNITSWNQAQVTHTYATPGVHDINITGTISGWEFNSGGDCLKLLGISQWGSLQLGNSGGYFAGCANLNLTATDAPDLAGTTTLYDAFAGCTRLGSSGSMDTWNVSRVTDMRDMFYNAFAFDQPIGAWNTSSVMDMSGMFWLASSFDQSLGAWNVSSVTNMSYMFSVASSFSQPIGAWNVSRVTDMTWMFSGASYDQPIGAWNVSGVTDMSGMFFGGSFDQPLGAWNVSGVTDMSWMFAYIVAQPVSDWNMAASITDMSIMFDGASSFDQPIGTWNVSHVTDMSDMFYGVTLSTTNYNALLLDWSQETLQPGVSFDAGHSRYSSAAAAARASIISKFHWTITDGGLASPPIAGYPVGWTIGLLTLACVATATMKRRKFIQ